MFFQERLSSLKAGLLTWKDHLKRLEQLSTECKDLKEKIKGDLKHPEDHLTTAIPVNIPEVSRDRETCTALLTNLDSTAERLRSLDNLNEDLSESLAPSDIKQLSQTFWLLGQRHSDDKHKLLVRMQILQMRIERMDLFHSHQSRFVTWIDKMRSNIDQKESRVSDLIFIFENHYRLEIEQKQKDMDNLIKLKDQMTEEKFSDSEEITQKTDDASKQYKDLKNHFDKKLAKLHQLLDAQLKLETELQELKYWLSETEKRINEPMKFECISSEHKKESETKIIDNELQLKQHSEKISSILNHGEMLISDQDSPCNISQDIINIKDDLERIETTWKGLVSTVTEKKHTHEKTWNQVQQYIDEYNILNEWIDKRQSFTNVEESFTILEQCKSLQKNLEETIAGVHTKVQSLNKLKSSYLNLAREGQLDENGEMKTMYENINEKYENLKKESTERIKFLEEKQNEFKSFNTNHEQQMAWIKMIDANLTEIQYSTKIDDDEKRRQVRDIQKQIKDNERAQLNKSAQKLLDNSTEVDSQHISVALNELEAIQADVDERLLKLLDDLCCDDEEHQDQNIQVDTLKFEQDRSVQADTLSLPIPDSGVFLSHITSPGTPDDLPELENDDLHEDLSLPDMSEKSAEEIHVELDRNIQQCHDSIRNLEETMDINDDLQYVVRLKFPIMALV